MPTFDLRLGDCLEVMREMPDNSVDAVVTDPPYCSGSFSEASKQQARGQGHQGSTGRILRGELKWFASDNMTTAGLVWLLRSVLNEAARIVKPTGSALVFTDWRMVPLLVPALESTGFRYRGLIAWDKGSPALGNGFRAQHEMIIHLAGDRAMYHDKCTGNVVRCKRVTVKEREHPNAKPSELMANISRVVCPQGGTVLDPFMGSGSTGVAAMDEGFNFIGIERDAEYFAIAEKRISAAAAQGALDLDAQA